MKNKDDYKIEIREGTEGIRQTAAMYVGNLENGEAVFHLLKEVLDNSIDEYFANHCNKIVVILHKDGSASVEDNGRGVPVYYIKEKKMTALEAIFCSLHSSGKYNKLNYSHSCGLNGIGLKTISALSEKTEVIIKKDYKEYSISFSCGKKIKDISERPIKSNKTGTFIKFNPDPLIFKNILKFDPIIVRNRLVELSFLCEGLTIEFIDEINNSSEIFPGNTNISDYVKYLSNNPLISDPIIVSGEKDGIIINIALQWLDDTSELEICKCYTNNILNSEGTHLAGFKSGLTRAVNNFIESSSDLPKNLKVLLSGKAIREGLVSAISLKHPYAKFSSQTKEKLVCEDAKGAVESIALEQLTKFFELNPIVSKKIIARCVNSERASEAARRAREAIRKSNLKESNIVLPGKLADCQNKDPDKCELFIVEGQSAGGSCKMGRNREFQAVLPLRGKVLNIERCEFRKMMDNEEIVNLITALGVGIGKNFDINKLRYGKVLICADSDVDGSHIRTLLLTFFFRQMPQLIINGNIFIAQPPLYRMDYRGNTYYLKNETALKNFTKEKKINKEHTKVSRFKGLGEFSAEQLWETTMNPEKRSLLKVTVDNYLEADKIFNILMGNQVDLRKDFIMSHSDMARLDI